MLITDVIRLVILIAFISTVTTCVHYKSKAERADNKILINDLEHEADTQKYTAAAKETEAKLYKQLSEAHEKHTSEINAIHKLYGDNVRVVDSMQHTVKETIKYLPAANRADLEKYAEAAANGVSECVATLIEVDKVAREYSAEIDLFEAAQPGIDEAKAKQAEKEKVDPHRRE